MNGNAPFRGEGRCLRGSAPLFLPNIGPEIALHESRGHFTLRVHSAKAREVRTLCYVQSSGEASDVMIIGEWLAHGYGKRDDKLTGEPPAVGHSRGDEPWSLPSV